MFFFNYSYEVRFISVSYFFYFVFEAAWFGSIYILN